MQSFFRVAANNSDFDRSAREDMNTKSICILANSIKFSGRCIAGMEVQQTDNGKWRLLKNWIRPLSHRDGGEIGLSESRLDNGEQPSVLDIIDVPLQEKAHVAGQPEDWLIEGNRTWTYRGRFGGGVLEKLVEAPGDLWLEFPHRSDRVSPQYLGVHKLPSLYLIRPNNLSICIDEFTDYNGTVKKKRRAHFDYGGPHYNLALTDPEMQDHYFPAFPNVPTGVLENGPSPDSFICTSLAPEFQGYHYKLVAAIIEP